MAEENDPPAAPPQRREAHTPTHQWTARGNLRGPAGPPGQPGPPGPPGEPDIDLPDLTLLIENGLI